MGGMLKIPKNFKHFVSIFFRCYLSTHSKEQPLELLGCSDQPFSYNASLKFEKIKTFIFRFTRYYAA